MKAKKPLKSGLFGKKEAPQSRYPLYQNCGADLWNDSRNDTIHGFHCALGLSFYIGCIWVQTGCSRVQNWLGGCNGELLLYYLLSTDNNISTFPLIFFQAVFASQIKKGNSTAEITPLVPHSFCRSQDIGAQVRRSHFAPRSPHRRCSPPERRCRRWKNPPRLL